MRPFILLAALSLSACAPRALFFHETTKVGFAADYNTSDSQPVVSSFGFKRRIVAVVPAQDRDVPDGNELHGTNRGEALAVVSKFHVRVGSFSDGVTITNNFASGMAARRMTRNPSTAAPAVSELMHSRTVEIGTDGTTAAGETVAEVAQTRTDAIRSKLVREDTFPPTTRKFKKRTEESQTTEKHDAIPEQPKVHGDDISSGVDLQKPASKRIRIGPDGERIIEQKQADGTWNAIGTSPKPQD